MKSVEFSGRKRIRGVFLFVIVLLGISCLAGAQTGYKRDVIYQFEANAGPYGIAIDGNGDYIVGEAGARGTSRTSRISRIGSQGYEVLYNETVGPNSSQIYDLAIAGNGDYIIAESWRGTIAKVSGGVRTTIYTNAPTYWAAKAASRCPLGVGIDVMVVISFRHLILREETRSLEGHPGRRSYLLSTGHPYAALMMPWWISDGNYL